MVRLYAVSSEAPVVAMATPSVAMETPPVSGPAARPAASALSPPVAPAAITAKPWHRHPGLRVVLSCVTFLKLFLFVVGRVHAFWELPRFGIQTVAFVFSSFYCCTELYIFPVVLCSLSSVNVSHCCILQSITFCKNCRIWTSDRNVVFQRHATACWKCCSICTVHKSYYGILLISIYTHVLANNKTFVENV